MRTNLDQSGWDQLFPGHRSWLQLIWPSTLDGVQTSTSYAMINGEGYSEQFNILADWNAHYIDCITAGSIFPRPAKSALVTIFIIYVCGWE